MRLDDNKSPAQWREICGIFERHGMRCSLAVVPASLTAEQGACLKELAGRGHVIMDHTPSHSIYTVVYPDEASFEAARQLPFVHDSDVASLRVNFTGEFGYIGADSRVGPERQGTALYDLPLRHDLRQDAFPVWLPGNACHGTVWPGGVAVLLDESDARQDLAAAVCSFPRSSRSRVSARGWGARLSPSSRRATR